MLNKRSQIESEKLDIKKKLVQENKKNQQKMTNFNKENNTLEKKMHSLN